MVGASMFVLLLISASALAQTSTTNYCDVPCQTGGTNIGCNQTLCAFGPSCNGLNPQYHDLTQSDVDLILSKVNGYRNQVASGSLNGFASASQMNTVVWSNDLASLAPFNLANCTPDDDKCHNTGENPDAGENVGTVYTYPNSLTFQDAMSQVIDAWFNEYQDANMNQLNSYQPTTPDIGHFTQLMQDKCVGVGCAGVSTSNGQRNTWNIACLFSQQNTQGGPVYITGTPCSECPGGAGICDATFPSLCPATRASDPAMTICGTPSTNTGGTNTTATNTGGTNTGGTNTGGANTGGNTGGNIGSISGTPISSGGNLENIATPDILSVLNAVIQNGNGQNLNTQIKRTECKRKICEKAKKSKKHNRKSHKPEISSVLIFELKRSDSQRKKMKFPRTIF